MKNQIQREAIAQRLTMALDQMEQNWTGKTVGIGYDCDTETGRITLSFEPAGDPENRLVVIADVEDVRPGHGNQN